MLSVALLLLAGTACMAAPLPDAALQALLEQRLAEGGQHASIVVGIVDGAGSRVFARGWADTQQRVPAGGDTLYEIGSVTKIFTALLLADMAERGEVGLHDAVALHLPSSVRVPTRSGRPIRLIDLVNHVSGLPRLPDNLGGDDSVSWQRYRTADLYAFLASHTLVHEVGEVEVYSNVGVALLGHALARRAGCDFPSLVARRITGPLGMRDTVFTEDAEQRHRLAEGHAAGGEPAPPMRSDTLAAAGMLRSTAIDMLRFLGAVLDPASPLAPAVARSVRPLADDPAVRLGWGLEDNFGSRILWHQGRTFGFASYIGIDVAQNRAIVVLSSRKQSVTDIGFHALNREHALAH